MSINSRTAEVKPMQRGPGLDRRLFSQKTTQIILLLFGALEALIAMAFEKLVRVLFSRSHGLATEVTEATTNEQDTTP